MWALLISYRASSAGSAPSPCPARRYRCQSGGHGPAVTAAAPAAPRHTEPSSGQRRQHRAGPAPPCPRRRRSSAHTGTGAVRERHPRAGRCLRAAPCRRARELLAEPMVGLLSFSLTKPHCSSGSSPLPSRTGSVTTFRDFAQDAKAVL